MTTKAKSAKSAKVEQNINYFSEVGTFGGKLTLSFVAEMNKYLHDANIAGDDEKAKACVNLIARRVKLLDTDENTPTNITLTIRDNYVRWFTAKCTDIDQVRDQEERTRKSIRAYIDKKQDYFTAFSAKCDDASGFVCVSVGSALPIKACGDHDFLMKLISKVTENKRFAKVNKEVISESEYNKKPLYIVIRHAKFDEKANAYVATEQTYKLNQNASLMDLGDCFKGRKINFRKGIINVHNGLFK